MENNTGTQQNINERLQALRADHAAAYAKCVRLTNLWVGVRIACTLVTLAMVAAGIFAMSVVGNLVLGLVVAFGISYMLRRGVRVLAWLGVVGGAASLVLLLMSLGMYLAMTGQYPLLYLYLVAAVADAAVQAIANGLLLADAGYRDFARELTAVSRQ